MRGMTQKQHEELRKGIKNAIESLRSLGHDNDVIEFMERSSLAIAGGTKENRDCGPETVASDDGVLGSSERHESYGQVSFNRISCTPPLDLYGSNLKHGNIISLSIRRSTKNRNLNRDTYYGGEEIVEVKLSSAQFAELLTSLNVGSGVPCTISHIFYNPMAECPETSQRQLNEDEFKGACREAMVESQKLVGETLSIENKDSNIRIDLVNPYLLEYLKQKDF